MGDERIYDAVVKVFFLEAPHLGRNLAKTALLISVLRSRTTIWRPARSTRPPRARGHADHASDPRSMASLIPARYVRSGGA